jgi:8-oxo-dGTP diphosphatase
MSDKPLGLAVKAIVTDSKGRSLLIRRSDECKHFKSQWEWPGGKCDPGESFDKALLREMEEETGLKVELTGLAGAAEHIMEKVHVIFLCMEAVQVGGEFDLSSEHDKYAWVPYAEYSKYELADNIRSFMLEYADKKR